MPHNSQVLCSSNQRSTIQSLFRQKHMRLFKRDSSHFRTCISHLPSLTISDIIMFRMKSSNYWCKLSVNVFLHSHVTGVFEHEKKKIKYTMIYKTLNIQLRIVQQKPHPQKNVSELKASSCSTSGNRCSTFVKNPVVIHEWWNQYEVITTNALNSHNQLWSTNRDVVLQQTKERWS